MSSLKKYILISLIVAVFNASILLFFFVSRLEHTDTEEYAATIQYISGNPDGKLFLHRLLKPAPLLIGSLLIPFLSPESSLVFQNLIFYFLSVLLVFFLIYRFYHNEKQAFYGTILYSTAYPMLAYGLAPLTDISGWFFYVLIILLSLNSLDNFNIKKVFLIGLLAGLGMLFKESLGAAPIFFVSLIFIATRFPIGKKIKYVLVFGLAFIFIPLISGVILYKLYSYSLIDWYLSVARTSESGFFVYTPLRILIEIGRMLIIGWVFVLVGAFKEILKKNKERIKILVSFLPASLSFFFWSFPHNRIIYIAFPLLVLLGSFGLLRNFKNHKINTFIELSLLFLYIFVNYAALEFFLRYGPIIQPPGTLFG